MSERHCAWHGCPELGEPRNVEIVMAAPGLGEGVAIMATFSDDVPLCDRHDAELREKVIGLLAGDLMEEADDGEDGSR